jgi:hypothetical protein
VDKTGAAHDFTNPQFPTRRDTSLLISAQYPQPSPRSQRNKCPPPVFLLSLSSTLLPSPPAPPRHCGASAARLEQVPPSALLRLSASAVKWVIQKRGAAARRVRSPGNCRFALDRVKLAVRSRSCFSLREEYSFSPFISPDFCAIWSATFKGMRATLLPRLGSKRKRVFKQTE